VGEKKRWRVKRGQVNGLFYEPEGRERRPLRIDVPRYLKDRELLLVVLRSKKKQSCERAKGFVFFDRVNVLEYWDSDLGRVYIAKR
jgi:hypothetical protein